MNRRACLRRLGALAALGLAAPLAAAQRWQNFDASSEADLRQQRRGRPFVLAFWSIHCPPCRDELKWWADGQRRYPGLRIVLVNTDADEDLPVAEQLLASSGARRLENRLLADDMVERVRWSVDPAWRGELPMARFYDAAHRASTRLGKLDPATLDQLLSQLAGGGQ